MIDIDWSVLPAYPTDPFPTVEPLDDGRDIEELLDDPYYDKRHLFDYPVRWAPPPDWWRELDEQGIRECVRDTTADAIAARLTTTGYRPDENYSFEALNEDAPLWREVRRLERNNPRSKVDFAGEANYALGRFLARLNPGSKYHKPHYLDLYSYVFCNWAMRYVRNWLKRTRDRAVKHYIWNYGGYEASPPTRREFGVAIHTGEDLYRPPVIALPRTWSAVHGTDEERAWFAAASHGKTKPCPPEKQSYWPRLAGGNIENCPDREDTYNRNVWAAIEAAMRVAAFARTLPGWHADAAWLAADGMSNVDIARTLGRHRNSVAKALKKLQARWLR
jgi:hypothetical protein